LLSSSHAPSSPLVDWQLTTANNHIDALNRFLAFCRTAYGLKTTSTCRKFSKKVIGRQAFAANGGKSKDSQVWSEEEYLKFRKTAYETYPDVTPIFDLAFGLGLRRGEAVALRVDGVHLDDDRMGPLGFVEVVRQCTRDASSGRYELRAPKCGKPRCVPIPYPWLQDILRQRISGRAPMSPSDNEGGLRYVVAKYSNSTAAKVVGVTEGAFRKWLKRWGITRPRRIINMSVDEKAVRDIRDHLLFGQANRGPEEHLFADHDGRLPSPDYISKVFGKLLKLAKLKAIRFHDLRHSFGTIWAERIPSSVLKAWMGHGSITTTEGYIHPGDEASRRVMVDALKKKDRRDVEEPSS
jgi:integrase